VLTVFFDGSSLSSDVNRPLEVPLEAPLEWPLEVPLEVPLEAPLEVPLEAIWYDVTLLLKVYSGPVGNYGGTTSTSCTVG
jgi:hypothetical protein